MGSIKGKEKEKAERGSEGGGEGRVDRNSRNSVYTIEIHILS